MLRSMTGFGRAEGMLSDRKVVVEIRSLNSKQFDANVRVPSTMREREPELRQWLSQRVGRGKADLVLSLEARTDVPRNIYDTEAVGRYFEQLDTMAKAVAPDHTTDLLGIVLRIPEVMRQNDEGLSSADAATIQETLDTAMDAFDTFRQVEGERLKDDLRASVDRLEKAMELIAALDEGRIAKVRDRLRGKVAELGVAIDQDRFEQELIYFIEKFDINEEKVRLRAHLTHLVETMEGENEQGRKLGFIGQEIGREINTIGSKANDAEIQRIVVGMKDDLEKIKEQVLNVL